MKKRKSMKRKKIAKISTKTKSKLKRKTKSKIAKKKQMPKQSLKFFKNLLIDKKKDLLDEVKRRSEDGKETYNEGVKDFADMASDSYESEFIYGVTDTERKYIDDVELSLKRIDDGTYGICDSCGKFISKARLEAIPFASLCITCKAKKEHL
ncbi:MAG: TraR/DksA family transcriptional regulator [Candidatus Firestonebacteria bacterium]